jgi:hypothetical protein
MRRIVLGIAAAVTTFAPAAVQADDQQIADFIRSKLQMEQQQGNLRGFNVDLRVEHGTVWFDGNVSNATQEALILRTAQQAGHLGVVQVVDDIEVSAPVAPSVFQNTQATPERVIPAIVPGPSATRTANLQSPLGVPAQQASANQQVQYQQQPPMASRMAGPAARVAAMPRSAPAAQDYVAPMVTGEVYGAPMDGAIVGEYATGGEPMPFASCGGGSCGGAIEGGYAGGGAPVAAGYGGGVGGPSEAANLPGYAWPGYAASPNFGAVTYPKQYSAAAWPYIGPFYPYPQVPLGWRKVTLEWDDGWWQLDFNDK